MKIQQNTVPAILFELTVGGYDGELVENVDPEKPFEFLFGHGNLLPAFESELLGLEAGDTFKFMLKSSEAYGSYDEELVAKFDISLFLDSKGMLPEDVAVDNFLPMKDDKGNMLNGKVLSVDDKYVEMDFNHPLADMDLYFTGEIIRVRPATENELEKGDVEVHEHTLWDNSIDGDPACNANE